MPSINYSELSKQIDKLQVTIEKMDCNLDTLKEKANDQIHGLDTRLKLVEAFIEARKKLEYIVLTAMVANLVGIVFIALKMVFQSSSP